MFELFDPQLGVHIAHGTKLPHWFQPNASYFVTFRTEDSIPADVSRRWYARRADWLEHHGIPPSAPDWRTQLNQLPEYARREFHNTFSQEYMDALDKGLGACVLRRPALSRIVEGSLRHFDGDRYHLGDFVVMPNHVHLIVCLRGTTKIVPQCTSWKRFSAKEINQALGTKGRFWQEESFDHLIRSPAQFAAIQRYIAQNPAHLKPGEYAAGTIVAGTMVAGTLRVPSPRTTQATPVDQAHGTRSVPATMEPS